ncbi:hypothetical protein NPIL_208721 [Nephila pilipes]|uniref:Uncharacterized protein n=1 Tax=Nephila pilipes TaxID=299642 RepID=A0A8X6TBZ5_NEPPI|nr:hypothetical protein NPIL_208721 [Nephila pilipes]
MVIRENPILLARAQVLVPGLFCNRSSSLFVVCRSYTSLTFLFVRDEESSILKSQAQECKEGVARSFPSRVTLGVQPLYGSSITISGPICQMHVSELSVSAT